MTVNDKPSVDCTDIKAMLSALVDGELDATRRHGAERHLAGCEACRELLSEAERNDALVAAAVGDADPATTLPGGFDEAVLRRIRGDGSAAPRSWVGWLGWFTAAAAVLLFGSLWWLDSPPPAASPVPVDRPAARPAWIRPVVNEVAQYPASVPAHATQQPLAAAASSPGTIPTLTRDDAEALESAAVVLVMLSRSDPDDTATIDRAGAIVEYDELLSRLAVARADLPVEEHPTLLAAESILYRLAHGPLSATDIQEIQLVIARLGLSERIDALSGRWSKGASL